MKCVPEFNLLTVQVIASTFVAGQLLMEISCCEFFLSGALAFASGGKFKEPTTEVGWVRNDVACLLLGPVGVQLIKGEQFGADDSFNLVNDTLEHLRVLFVHYTVLDCDG